MAVEAQATARGVRTSAQKAGLVCELIRGKSVNEAIAILQFTRKTIALIFGSRTAASIAAASVSDPTAPPWTGTAPRPDRPSLIIPCAWTSATASIAPPAWSRPEMPDRL